MVQESLLGGLFMTRPIGDLTEGYNDPNLEFLREGEFTSGEGDISLSTRVSIN
jgi:hypothetical protein